MENGGKKVKGIYCFSLQRLGCKVLKFEDNGSKVSYVIQRYWIDKEIICYGIFESREFKTMNNANFAIFLS